MAGGDLRIVFHEMSVLQDSIPKISRTCLVDEKPRRVRPRLIINRPTRTSCTKKLIVIVRVALLAVIVPEIRI